jgi:parallel beta-helix repeat protein
MKKIFLIFIILIILSFQGLNGCIEEELGNIIIIGKGNYKTITSAIDSASNGDKILVNQGVYNEEIILNKSISLIATDKNSTIIQYIGNETGKTILLINEENCTIDGFIFTCINKSLKANGIKIKSNNNTIINNTIYNLNYGIYIDNSNNISVINNSIYDNDEGLYMVHSINDDILSNNFTNNSVYGIYMIYASDNNLFKYNQISNNNIGIRIKGSKQNKFEKNIFLNNNRQGIYFCCGAVNNIIFNNSMIDNNPNADDEYNNQWYYKKTGNYWSDYTIKNSNFSDNNNDGFWDTPYIIYGDTKDYYPLVNSIKY